MAAATPPVFDDLRLDHVACYVASIEAARDWLAGGYGLTVRAALDGAEVRAVELGANQVRLLLRQPLAHDHPGAAYLARHGDGVSDIALRVSDAAAAFDEAVRRGAHPVSPPARHGDTVTAVIGGFGDVVHTFVERAPASSGPVAAGLRPVPYLVDGPGGLLATVDHFAVCVEPGHIDATVRFYRGVLDFELIFAEALQIGSRGMTTKVVQSRSGSVTLTLIEPDVSQDSGHIDEFLAQHGGAGVQHIAFATDGIVAAVDALRGRGVQFMETPQSYYQHLLERVVPARYTVEELQRREILVDEDHDGQLYQIFTRSVHPRGTIFLELIERLGARSFGSGNITALYQAAERQHRARAA
jgi:4-hydroxymandelate synthase